MFIPLILLCAVGFIYSKAIPEELQKHAGKQKSELPKGWETGGLLYKPRTDGRPIYVPPMLKSDKTMKDVLDDYYKSTLNRTVSTTVTSLIDKKGIEEEYEDPSNSKKVSLSNTKRKSTKFPILVKTEMKQKKTENKNINVLKGVTKSTFQPTVEGDDFDAPRIVNKADKKPKSKMPSSLLQTENIDDYDEPVIQHTSKKQATNKKNNAGMKVSAVEIDDFEEPVVSSVKSKQESKNLKSIKTDSQSKDEYEEPMLRQSSKKSLRYKNKEKLVALPSNKQIVNLENSRRKQSVPETSSGKYDVPVIRETSKSVTKKRKPIRIRFQRVRLTSERPTNRTSNKKDKT